MQVLVLGDKAILAVGCLPVNPYCGGTREGIGTSRGITRGTVLSTVSEVPVPLGA